MVLFTVFCGLLCRQLSLMIVSHDIWRTAFVVPFVSRNCDWKRNALVWNPEPPLHPHPPRKWKTDEAPSLAVRLTYFACNQQSWGEFEQNSRMMGSCESELQWARVRALRDCCVVFEASSSPRPSASVPVVQKQGFTFTFIDGSSCFCCSSCVESPMGLSFPD